MLEKEQFKAET